MQLANLKDIIPLDMFAEGEDGLSRFRDGPSVAYDVMRSLNTDQGYDVSWSVVAVGERRNGCMYVAGNLTLIERDQHELSGRILSQQTVPGSAEGPSEDMTVAGVVTMALTNALLRGLGMADYLYAGVGDKRPPVAAAVPARPLPTPTIAHVPARQAPRFPGNARPQAQAPRSFGAWAGSKMSPKTGQWQGVTYDKIPIEVLQKWASGESPNPLAVKELQARMGGAAQVENSFHGQY